MRIDAQEDHRYSRGCISNLFANNSETSSMTGDHYARPWARNIADGVRRRAKEAGKQSAL
jgi:hypothetical protein